MKCVLHTVFNDDLNTLFKNKSFFEFEIKHFLTTNYKNINENVFKQFEQIFYFKNKDDFKNQIKNIILYFNTFGYDEIYVSKTSIINPDQIVFVRTDDLLKHFTVINNIVNI
jgi:hypothetical protein